MTVDCGLALGNLVMMRLSLLCAQTLHKPVDHHLKTDFLHPLTCKYTYLKKLLRV